MPLIDDPEQLGKLQGWLESQRRPAEDTIQETVDLFMPFRGDIFTRQSPGQRRKPLFDSFGVTVADRFTNFLNGSLFPSSSDWVGLRASGVPYDHALEVALDESSKRIMDALADSNFYSASDTFVRDWGVIGNTTFMVQHDDESADGPDEFGGLIFDPIAWSRVWWVFSHIGRPLVISREVEMPAYEVYHFFQKPGDRIPDVVVEKYRDKPFDPISIKHIVQRNPDGKKGTAKKPWTSHWLYQEGQGAFVLRKGGFDLQPYVAARMLVMDGDQYGRGRGQIARPQMKGCNEITRQKMIAYGKEMNPQFLAEDDSIIAFDYAPGGHIVVRPPKVMNPQYLRSGTAFDLIDKGIEMMHKTISEAFLGDVLGEPESQDRSAKATLSRESRALVRLAGTGQTMDHELLGPTIENVVEIMLKRGALPELQAVSNERKGMKVKPVFSSPFYTAMKSQSMQRVRVFLEERLQLFERGGEFGPFFLEDIDPDKYREISRELADVPAKLFRDIEQVNEMRNARAEQAALAQITALANRETSVQVRPNQGSRAASAGSLTDAATGINAA